MNRLYLPAALALLAGGIWLGWQQREISALRNHELLGRKELTKPPSEKVAPNRLITSSTDSDWRKIAAGQTGARGGKLSDQTARQLWELSLSMDRGELVAALDELSGLDLPPESRDTMESVLFAALVKLDPELVLDRAGEKLDANGDDQRAGLRSRAFAAFLEKDHAAAAAWLDRQISAGNFESKRLDGRSDSRIRLESALLKIMISADPVATGSRVAAMSEFDAHETLRRLSGDVTPQTEAAFVEIVRKHLPDAAHLETLALLAGGKAEDLPGVSACLQRMDVTPAEREACVAYTVRVRMSGLKDQNPGTGEEVDGLRQWIASEIPERLENLTGTMLAEATLTQGGLTYPEAVEFAIRYHESTGSDELLCAFLKVPTKRFDAAEAGKLVSKITDPSRRAEMLKTLK